MEYVPCKTFGRIIDRHSGDADVRTLNCSDLFRVMAFAQLTQRKFLRDIEVRPSANQTMDAQRVYWAVTNRAVGVICNQGIALKGLYISKNYSEQLRRIRFKDPESGKTLVFLSHSNSLPPLAIAAL